MAYCIVEFVESKEVEVVPAKWLVKSSEGVLCYWPPYKSVEKIVKATKHEEDLTELWTSYTVKIIQSFETYTSARLKLSMAQDTDNLESEVSCYSTSKSQRISKRKRKQPNKLFDTESSSDTEECSGLKRPPPVSFPNMNFSKNQIHDGDRVFSNSPFTANSPLPCGSPTPNSNSGRTLQPASKSERVVVNLQSSCDVDSRGISFRDNFDANSPAHSSTPASSSGIDPAQQNDILLKVLKNLERVSANQEQHSIMLTELLNHARINNDTISIERPEGMPQLPIKSTDELDQWESFLQSPGNYSYVCKLLSSVGGNCVEQTTRRTMSRIITSEFARQFNWSGRPPKKPFKTLKLKAVVADAVKRCFKEKEGQDNKIESSIKDWLKYATIRFAHQQKKPNN